MNHDPRYEGAQVLRAMLVVAYNDGSPADLINVGEGQLLVSWRRWLERLELFKKGTQKTESRRPQQVPAAE
jgi:hypothetical protein